MTQPHDGREPAEQPAALPPANVPPAAPARQHVIRRTRTGGVWTGLALAAVLLVFLLIFILENGQQASIAYFGAHGHLPLGIALLLAAVAGALLVIIPGTGRIIQLRITARRHRQQDTTPPAVTAQDTAPAQPPAGHA